MLSRAISSETIASLHMGKHEERGCGAKNEQCVAVQCSDPILDPVQLLTLYSRFVAC